VSLAHLRQARWASTALPTSTSRRATSPSPTRAAPTRCPTPSRGAAGTTSPRFTTAPTCSSRRGRVSSDGVRSPGTVRRQPRWGLSRGIHEPRPLDPSLDPPSSIRRPRQAWKMRITDLNQGVVYGLSTPECDASPLLVNRQATAPPLSLARASRSISLSARCFPARCTCGTCTLLSSPGRAPVLYLLLLLFPPRRASQVRLRRHLWHGAQPLRRPGCCRPSTDRLRQRLPDARLPRHPRHLPVYPARHRQPRPCRRHGGDEPVHRAGECRHEGPEGAGRCPAAPTAAPLTPLPTRPDKPLRPSASAVLGQRPCAPRH